MSAPSPSDARNPLEGQRIAALVVGVFGALGLGRALALRWTCDDAFISFRYAQNLVDGLGLVYNAGEHVEGYTNLLWTLAIAAGLSAGLDPLAVAAWLGIACYAGLTWTLWGASLRRAREHGLVLLPLAAGAVLVSDDFHEWATGGLETMLFTWLAAASLLRSRQAAQSPRAALAAGALLSLLLLTRPDGLLFVGAAALGLWALPPGGDARAARAAIRPLLALPVTTLTLLVVWKLAYYGELLPTAFHSKSVLRPWYEQGLVYIGLYAAKNWYLAPAVAAAAWLRASRRGDALSDVDRDGLVLAGSAALFLLYLAHVGGDFMFARRVLPAVPLLLLAVEGELARLSARSARSLAFACVVAAALPYPVLGQRALVRGIADERRFYHESALLARKLQGQVVGDALTGTQARVMYEGGMCAFGYWSGLPWLAEMSGLTHYSLAKLPLETRGRPGHEKHATEDWLRERGVHFVMSQRFPPIPRGDGNEPLDALYFGEIAVARIVHYDDAVMDRLRAERGVRFAPIERVVEQRQREIERADRAEAERLYAWLDAFYFSGNGERAAEWKRSLRALIDAKPR
jgi:hypothetical protein